MSKKTYKNSATWYDALIEPLIKTFRTLGVTLAPPRKGMSVLDIGCGTGTHLNIYQKAGCRVFGLDLSPEMLSAARAKLAKRAGLYLGDASRMPFPNESLDLITAMFTLHTMPTLLRSLVIDEARRIMKKVGRFLVIDYHPGPVRFPEGWLYKAVITGIESLASGEHFANYREFIANGGLAPLLIENGLAVEKQKIVGGGTIGLYLLRSSQDPTYPLT